jgi:hypothetical protein
MAVLTIRASQMGPLSLRLLSADGRLIAQQPPPLSSGRPSVAVTLDEGAYVVIASRPSGQVLTQEAFVGPNGGVVAFQVEGNSPNEFMGPATERGLVPAVPDSGGRLDHRDAALAQLTERPATAGDAGKAMRAIGQAALGFGVRQVVSRSAPALTSAVFRSLIKTTAARPSPPAAPLALRRWTWRDGGWRRDDRDSPPLWSDLGAGYFRIRVDGGAEPARAFALLDEDGYGPVVIAPPFRDGLDLTFLADGVTAATASERVGNPSAVRVPVAVSLPGDPRSADLLGGLSAAALPGADQLWAAGADDDDVDSAFALLYHKQQDPAAAVLAAHFLVRFSPKRAPVKWLINLCSLLPEVADGPVLLAWRYISAGGVQGAHVDPGQVRDLLRQAARRPVHYFARSRSLLSQGMRLYGPWSRRRDPNARNPKPRPGDFLDVGADAGGLEAFWGSSPIAPGRPAAPPHWPSAPPRTVGLRGGLFVTD